MLVPTGDSWHESERMFFAAQNKLQAERGRPRLESVQARLASVLYLLQVSRPNQAYYQFGTTVQLAISLGLHRVCVGPVGQQDRISSECRKRTFWAASTLDTYLCVILGRPPLIHLDDVDQLYPAAIDDDELAGPNAPANGQPSRDSIIKASILHAQIARIVKKASREQSSVHRKSAKQKLEIISELNADINTWRSSLPTILSGAIHPTSLVPVFRRQVAVLELAHSHARMLVNRSSYFCESTPSEIQRSQAEECMNAAKSTLDIVGAASLSKHNILWYTQFVTFNALAIVYLYLIDRKPGNMLYLAPSKYDTTELLRQAEDVQKHLLEATQGNAPSLRYSVILEELVQEVKCANEEHAGSPSHRSVQVEPSTHAGNTQLANASTGDASLDFHDPASYTLNAMNDFANFPTDEELWFALDSLPFSGFGRIG